MPEKIFLVDVERGEDFQEFAAEADCLQDILALMVARGINRDVSYFRARRVVCVDMGNAIKATP